ncbi:glycosyltransferase [Campylobacter coli]|nr:glycosyltransferase [Campylobacter coli]
MLKLSSENKKFIKVVLDSFFRIYLAKLFSNFKPKKYKAFTQYTIISAVYNVEKYLDDYFKSIISQRLDFRKNIFMILVDDGSTDNSAQIIKTYQKKYPKNIVYLYKENSGQASARNLGLKYMQENGYKTPWITFADPDDFLDRNYFYEVDKFLSTHKDNNICMISCNVIFYHEKQKLYKDNHALNFKFKNGIQVKENCNLDVFIQLFTNSSFINTSYLAKYIRFDEKLKPNFEDAKFINEYLLKNINLKSVFLPKAKYFYRKREDGSSTLDDRDKTKDYYIAVLNLGYLKLFKDTKITIPSFIQNVVLYDIFWQIKTLISNPEKLAILNNDEKKLFKELLFDNFKFIDSCNIKKFNLNTFDFFYKKGILNYFKNEDLSENIAFIEDIDDKNDEILVKYYFNNIDHKVKILLDDEVAIIKHSKIRQYDLLDKVFLYEKRIWLKLKNDAKNLDIFVNSQKLKLIFNNNFINDLNGVLKALNKQKKQRSKNSNLWLFADMSWRADDNAEHLYRYVMHNHPKQQIAFILSKNSIDYPRLKKEGFRLIDPKGFYSKYLIYKADKIISSHIDRYIFNALGGDTLKTKDFIFLQHGVTKDDLSRWLNQRKIDIFITSTKAEYDSIAGDFNQYKFSTKEVVLTGLARWDALIKNNVLNTKQILIMPTWRKNIVGMVINFGTRELKDNFKESEYFQKWNSLLNSNDLKALQEKYFFSIIFNPHPNVIPYLKDFNIPSYVKFANQNESLQALFCNSSLMITDYSSVAFEMAYLKKPVIYYQFDEKEFFINHSYFRGYFNYKKNGFGPVVESEENLLKELKNLLQNDYRLFDAYKNNINSTFAFKNGDSCWRTYKVIEYK